MTAKKKVTPEVRSRSVSILGAGNWGTVLSILASQSGATVYLYDRSASRVNEMQSTRENKRYLPGIPVPPSIVITSNLDEALEASTLLVPVVPSHGVRELAKKMAPRLSGEHFLVHATKGLEPSTHKRMSEVLVEETGCLRVGAISGPNLALELARGLPGATVISSKFDEVVSAVMEAFASPQFRVYGNSDLVGVEWTGALKNILAIAAGILNELALGQNAFAMLLTRGVAEISRFIALMGANQSTLMGLAGIGDIFATCTSPLSRNFRAGQLLAKGHTIAQIEESLQMTVEGLNTIRVAHEISMKKRLELPILSELWNVAYQSKTVTIALRDLMERPSSFEIVL